MMDIVLNNGSVIPPVGFGCYNPKGEDMVSIIKDAIKSGYRLFDTASFYETERALGQAVKESDIDRENLYIQSKLWIDEMGYEGAKAAIDRTLNRLDMDYIDTYFIHWPRQYAEGEDVSTKSYEVLGDWKDVVLDTYRALEKMVEEGKIKSIGLSNFLPHHLMHILDNCKIKPVIDQLEVHIGYTQPDAVMFAKQQGITVEAWSPLGRGDVLSEPLFVKMAEKYNVTVGQLALRFVYQCGAIPIPKSSSPQRQIQNLDIFDFEISKEDFYMISCIVPMAENKEHPDFNIPNRASNFEQ